jgi:hypothetical protein
MGAMPSHIIRYGHSFHLSVRKAMNSNLSKLPRHHLNFKWPPFQNSLSYKTEIFGQKMVNLKFLKDIIRYVVFFYKKKC